MNLYTQNIFLVCVFSFIQPSCCLELEQDLIKNATIPITSTSMDATQSSKSEEISNRLPITSAESILMKAKASTESLGNYPESKNETDGSQNRELFLEHENSKVIPSTTTKVPFVVLPADVEAYENRNRSQIHSGFSSTVTDKPENGINSVFKIALTDSPKPSLDTPIRDEGNTRNSISETCDTSNANFVIKLHSDSTNCVNYYEMCVQNGSNYHPPDILKSCPSGQLFDTIDLKCMNKRFAQCGDYICKSLDGLFPDPKHPYKFIHCFGGRPKRRDCEPVGTVYDEKQQICIRVPEELPISLQIFKAFIWFVDATRPGENSTQGMETLEDYATATLMAVIILIPNITTVLVLLLLCHKKSSDDDIDPFVMDSNEFQGYRPSCPISLELRSLRPSSLNHDEIIIADGSQYATTRL